MHTISHLVLWTYRDAQSTTSEEVHQAPTQPYRLCAIATREMALHATCCTNIAMPSGENVADQYIPRVRVLGKSQNKKKRDLDSIG